MARKSIRRPATAIQIALRDRLIRHQIFNQRVAAGTSREFLALIEAANVKILARLEKKIAWIAERGFDSSAFTLRRLEVNLREIRSLARDLYREAGSSVSAAARAAAKVEAETMAGIFDASIRSVYGSSVGIVTAPIAAGTISTLVSKRPLHGGLLGEWIDSLSVRTAERLRREIRSSLVAGENIREIMDRIRGDRVVRMVNGKRVVSRVGGILRATRREANTIARTAMNSTMNAVRGEWIAANGSLFRGERWISTLDTATTPECIDHDQHLYAIGSHEPLDGGPPWGAGPGNLHWGCRSTSVPELKSPEELGLEGVVREPGVGERAARGEDGKSYLVDGNLSYGDWLSTQSPAVVREALGARRADLYLSGDVSFGKLFDDHGRFVPVADLVAGRRSPAASD